MAGLSLVHADGDRSMASVVGRADIEPNLVAECDHRRNAGDAGRRVQSESTCPAAEPVAGVRLASGLIMLVFGFLNNCT